MRSCRLIGEHSLELPAGGGQPLGYAASPESLERHLLPVKAHLEAEKPEAWSNSIVSIGRLTGTKGRVWQYCGRRRQLLGSWTGLLLQV